jgi:K+-sensing histidine kinase KdpD
VLFSAWYAGFGPALLVSVLATFAVNYTLIQPVGQMMPDTMGDVAPLVLFVLLSAFVSRLTGSLRASEERSWVSKQNCCFKINKALQDSPVG